MKIIDIHDAKTHLSRLVEEAAKGEPFIIAKDGKPIVKVIPYDVGLAEKAEEIMRRYQNTLSALAK